jgi:putative transposase
MEDIFKSRRISQMDLGEIYFWTNTIKDWKHLLKPEKYKDLILSTLEKMVLKELISVYAFVIMPNHIHLIWKLNKLNGKEKPHASFNKETSHIIVKDLKEHHPQVLSFFVEKNRERQHRIWQRDPMAIKMDNLLKVTQKVEYIHNNPLSERWNLARRPENYYWSSASYYETGKKDFSFLEDYRVHF